MKKTKEKNNQSKIASKNPDKKLYIFINSSKIYQQFQKNLAQDH